MQFLVYLQAQNISCESAHHDTSRSTAKLVVDAGYAGNVGQGKIQLWTRLSWREVKRIVLGTEVEGDACPELLAPLSHYPAYNYPLPYSLLRQYQRPRIFREEPA